MQYSYQGFKMHSVCLDFVHNEEININLKYNFCILNQLYMAMQAEQDAQKKLFFYKPTVLTLGAINEAILYDFTENQPRQTGIVNNILSSFFAYNTKGKGVRQLMELAKKHPAFADAGQEYYEDVEALKTLRNRVHIQNEWHCKPALEEDAFNEESLHLGERCLEKTLKILQNATAAPDSADLDSTCELPWQRLESRP